MAIQVFQEELPFSNKKTVASISTGGSYNNPVIIPISLDLTNNSDGNIFETVLYIRNDDISAYYNNIVISLVRDPNPASTTTTPFNFSYIGNSSYLASLTGGYNEINAKLGFDISSPVNFSIAYPNSVTPVARWKVGSTLSGTFTAGSSTFTTASASSLTVGMSLIADTILPNGTVVTQISGSTIYMNKKSVATGAKSFQPYTGDSEIEAKFSYGYEQLSPLEWDNSPDILVIPFIGVSPNPDTSYKAIRMRIKFKTTTSILTSRHFSIDITHT